jgi:hypothetical protein
VPTKCRQPSWTPVHGLNGEMTAILGRWLSGTEAAARNGQRFTLSVKAADMQNSGKNGNGNEPTTKPTEPTNLPTAEEVTAMELTVLNSLLAKFQSRGLISITRRDANGTPVYSINLPVGKWQMEGGKFLIFEPTTLPTRANTSQQPEITAS